MSEGWDGVERRTADKKLASAIAEVKDLREAAAKLAEAVTVRTDEFQRVIWRVGMMLAALFIILVAFSLWRDTNLNKRLDASHDLITCLLLIEPSSRTAQSLVNCQVGSL